jgi:hypothetical protein
MKRSITHLCEIVFSIMALAACAGVSPYKPLTAQISIACPDVFARQSFRAVHQIEMESALSGKSLFIGAAKATPDDDALHTVLMSVEGMVLFEGEMKKGVLRIISAFGPLNDPDFARGLMADVSFLLLKPATLPAESGLDDKGLKACRWPSFGGGVTELTSLGEGAVRIRRYDEKRRITKEAMAMPPFDRGMPAGIVLKSFRPAKYTIKLKLIEVEFIN